MFSEYNFSAKDDSLSGKSILSCVNGAQLNVTLLHMLRLHQQIANKKQHSFLKSFNSTDLILEGLLREAGALFRPKIKPSHINELNIRKFLLRCLYGRTFMAPYNENLAEFRTGLRCLTSLFCLSRCADFRELKKGDIEFDHNNVIIHWRKRKNNQRSKMQQSLVPKLPDHPLCLFNAFEHFIEKTQLANDQFINCKISRNGNPYGDSGITGATCYANTKKICSELNIDQITEKMCKAVGTRYIISFLFFNLK